MRTHRTGTREGVRREGTVLRLSRDKRFGYVRTVSGARAYFFLVGIAIRHDDAKQLRVGARVSFSLTGQGRVSHLVVISVPSRLPSRWHRLVRWLGGLWSGGHS